MRTGAHKTKGERMSTNIEHCKYISETLDAYADSRVIRGSDGEVVILDEYQDEPDNSETLTMFDWLEGALDWEYFIGADGDYRGAKVLVAFGGPNIYVNTRTKSVDLYWWNKTASWGISEFAAEELDNCLKELFEMHCPNW